MAIHARSRLRVLRELHVSSGAHYWEVFVERLASAGGVVVGLVAAPLAPEAAALCGRGSVGYCSSGAVLKDGRGVLSAEAYEEGDTVGVFVDMNVGRAEFYRNEAAQSPKIGSGEGEALPVEHHAVVVAVSLSEGEDEVVVYSASRPPDACALAP